MKSLFRTLFAPLLNMFEQGSGPYHYKPSFRLILIIVGILFCCLAAGVFMLVRAMDPSYLLPVVVFGGAGLLSLIVGLLGSDRAVAKIWNARK